MLSTARRLVILTAAAALFAPAPAHAQLGGLLKKAKAAIDKSAGAQPGFDQTVVELDGTRLGNVITGVKTGQAATGKNGASAAELHRRANAASTRRDSLLAGRDREAEHYHEVSTKTANCVRFFHDSLSRRRNEDMPKTMAKLGGYQGPAMQDLIRLATAASGKLAAGDSAAAYRLRDSMYAKMGIDLKADSAKAIAACGKVPPKPSWLAESEALLTESNEAMAEARALEEQSRSAAVKASGLTAQQYAMALERVAAFVAAKGKPVAPWKFSGTELSALGDRMSELQLLGIR
jgi:hypothetical protein